MAGWTGSVDINEQITYVRQQLRRCKVSFLEALDPTYEEAAHGDGISGPKKHKKTILRAEVKCGTVEIKRDIEPR